MRKMRLLFFLLVCSSALYGQADMKKLIDENFAFAEKQYRYMMTQNPDPAKMPQSYDQKTGKFDSRNITWWCSGFYPGSLWYIYEQTRSEAIRKEAERALGVIEPNQHFTGNHDLGFMIYCSFGNAYRITGKEAYKAIILNGAQALSTRYRPEIRSIQSWNKNDYFDCPVIIDNLMNLEMMIWATKNGGDSKFREIAVTHANTAIENHFRPDYSSYHVIDYDMSTGKPRRKATWQGAANTSAWARGQAWALYGYTMLYGMTRDPAYLKQAQGIAGFILDHPNLPEDKIPYWDFDAPLQPKAKRDASAGAIMASALLELGQYTSGAEKERYVKDATQMIRSLASDAYRAPYGENGGFLLKHSVGALPLNSEIDVPLVYADYYFLEALKRYKDWYLK
ncbi:MAG: glycoside hydrolase family 88 protein [Leadbetterella sp.]|nr:glycoside hydrolase family 88 protein [Leadbetterella sp.]